MRHPLHQQRHREALGYQAHATSGAAESAKLTGDQCAEEQRAITAIMGEEAENATRWLQPFMRNHASSFEILAAQDWSAKEWADKVNRRLKEVNYKIKDRKCDVGSRLHRRADPRCAVSTRPRKTSRCSTTTTSSPSASALELWELGMIRLGYDTRRTTSAWTWATTASMICGVRLPVNMPEGDSGNVEADGSAPRAEEDGVNENEKAEHTEKDDEKSGIDEHMDKPQEPAEEEGNEGKANEKKQNPQENQPQASCPLRQGWRRVRA